MKGSNIRIFENEQFGKIRTAGTAENPLFCLVDLCRALDLQTGATKNRLNPKGISSIKTPTSGGAQELLFVNEPNMYKVIMRSDKPQAETFQDWVCEDVLPAIRKTGKYEVTPQIPDFSNPAEAARAWADQYEANVAKQKVIEEQRPKVEFFEAVAGSKDAVEMQKVAKMLDFKNVGRNNMFKILREQKILQSDNIPYQEYQDRGYFRVIEQKYENASDGMPHVSFKTLVYQKGIDFIRKTLISLGFEPRNNNNLPLAYET